MVPKGKWDILGHRTKGEKTPPAIRSWGGERGGSCERGEIVVEEIESEDGEQARDVGVED